MRSTATAILHERKDRDYSWFYLINIIIPILFLFLAPAGRWVPGLFLILAVAVVHTKAFRGSRAWRAGCIAFEILLMTALMVLLNPGYVWMIFYPASALGFGFEIRQIGVGLAFICLYLSSIVLVQSRYLVIATGDWLMILAGLVAGIACAYGTWSQRQSLKSKEALKQANLQIERLTQIAERERISQDLHDVMGHELSMITLKAQLAERLIERDPARTRAEIQDIEQAARLALSRVREYIADIRQPNLEEEWKEAERLLSAAGIAARLLAADRFPLAAAPASQVFAMCLRESVTNLVRHSRAAHAYLQMWRADGALHLIVADDGVGISCLTDPQAPLPDTGRQAGNGLNGMRARVAALGGRLMIWSNQTLFHATEVSPSISLPWQRGTALYFQAPLPESTAVIREEAKVL